MRIEIVLLILVGFTNPCARTTPSNPPLISIPTSIPPTTPPPTTPASTTPFITTPAPTTTTELITTTPTTTTPTTTTPMPTTTEPCCVFPFDDSANGRLDPPNAVNISELNCVGNIVLTCSNVQAQIIGIAIDYNFNPAGGEAQITGSTANYTVSCIRSTRRWRVLNSSTTFIHANCGWSVNGTWGYLRGSGLS